MVDPVMREIKDSINVARQRNNLRLTDRSWDWTEHPTIQPVDLLKWRLDRLGYPGGRRPLHVSPGG